MESIFKAPTRWHWELWSPASKRSSSYVMTDAWDVGNINVAEGLNYALDAAFAGGAQKSEWYLAVFNDDYTPLDGDTYQSPGYNESVNYEGSRPTWQQGGAALKSISNLANVATFTMSAEEIIYGSALVSASTKGDSVSGEVLYCSSKFDTPKQLYDDEILSVSCTITAADA